MINLTRIDLEPIIVNADEIETVEWRHESTLTLRSGRKIIVRESSDDIIRKVIEFRRLCSGKMPDMM